MTIPRSSEPLASEVLQALAKLTTLREINIQCPVRDEDVIAITRQAPLLALDLSCSSHLTDESLHAISRLHDLESMTISAASFSVQGLEQLARLEQLRSLYLVREFHAREEAESDFTDEQVAAIGRLESLERLELHSSRVTDAGLAELRSLNRLKFLRITAKLPTGAAFAELGALKNLEALALDLPNASTELLSTHLPRLTGLKHLSVPCGLLDAVKLNRSLRKALPGVRSHFPTRK